MHPVWSGGEIWGLLWVYTALISSLSCLELPFIPLGRPSYRNPSYSVVLPSMLMHTAAPVLFAWRVSTANSLSPFTLSTNPP